MVTRGHR